MIGEDSTGMCTSLKRAREREKPIEQQCATTVNKKTSTHTENPRNTLLAVKAVDGINFREFDDLLFPLMEELGSAWK